MPIDLSEIDKDAVRSGMAKLSPHAKSFRESQAYEIHRFILREFDEVELRAWALLSLLQNKVTDDWCDMARAHPRMFVCIMGARAFFQAHPTTFSNLTQYQHYGTLLWDWSYRWCPNDDAVAVSVGLSSHANPQALHAFDHIYAYSSARWVDGACTTLTCGHKLFSSLALTRIGEDTYSDIRVPWPAFEVRIPDHLLRIGAVECVRMRFSLLRGVFLPDMSRTDCALFTVETSVGELLQVFRTGKDAVQQCLFASDLSDESLSSEEVRAMMAAKRALVGLLYMMQHTTNFQERMCKSKSAATTREGPPDHRVIFVGSPVAFDTREALRGWVRHGNGRSAPPSVQSLVRGHYKRQVVGAGRTKRNVIWIEPYWRGPEDAPIKARSFDVQ